MVYFHSFNETDKIVLLQSLVLLTIDVIAFKLFSVFLRHHDTQHNDTQDNDTHHNGTLNNYKNRTLSISNNRH